MMQGKSTTPPFPTIGKDGAPGWAVISGGWISKEKLVLILAQGTQLVNIVRFRELAASSLDFLWLSSGFIGSAVDIFVF